MSVTSGPSFEVAATAGPRGTADRRTDGPDCGWGGSAAGAHPLQDEGADLLALVEAGGDGMRVVDAAVEARLRGLLRRVCERRVRAGLVTADVVGPVGERERAELRGQHRRGGGRGHAVPRRVLRELRAVDVGRPGR